MTASPLRTRPLPPQQRQGWLQAPCAGSSSCGPPRWGKDGPTARRGTRPGCACGMQLTHGRRGPPNRHHPHSTATAPPPHLLLRVYHPAPHRGGGQARRHGPPGRPAGAAWCWGQTLCGRGRPRRGATRAPPPVATHRSFCCLPRHLAVTHPGQSLHRPPTHRSWGQPVCGGKFLINLSRGTWCGAAGGPSGGAPFCPVQLASASPCPSLDVRIYGECRTVRAQAAAPVRDVRAVLSSLSPSASAMSVFAKPEVVTYTRFELRGSHVGLKVVELADCPIGHLVVSGFRGGASAARRRARPRAGAGLWRHSGFWMLTPRGVVGMRPTTTTHASRLARPAPHVCCMHAVSTLCVGLLDCGC